MVINECINLKSRIGVKEFYSACKRILFTDEFKPHKFGNNYKGVTNFLTNQGVWNTLNI